MSLDKLQELINIQGDDGNWNCDPYMHGMYNGMELARSMITDSKPLFRDPPDRWLIEDGDECLRRQHPVLQSAWEEYMILKRLMGDTK